MKWFPGWFNDMGFIVTFLGFAFAIWQILLIGRRQKAISAANEKLIKRINTKDNLINIAKILETISDLKTSVISGNYNYVDKKIPEIKSVLINCRSI